MIDILKNLVLASFLLLATSFNMFLAGSYSDQIHLRALLPVPHHQVIVLPIMVQK